MKVLQINSVCGFGSTGRIVTDISSKLREHKIENYIAYGHGREALTESANTVKIGTKLDYYLQGVLTRLFDAHGLLGSEKATHNFINQVKNIDPDIIHLHNIHDYYINIKILFDYLKKARKPVVWTLHDCWSFTGHCAHFTYAQCDKWIEGCYQCPQKKYYPASFFRDNSKRNYDMKREIFNSLENLTIVTPSQWLADLVKKSFLSKYPIKVINHGIDTDIFKPVAGESILGKYKIGPKFTILGVANIWGKIKGLKYFKKLSEMYDNDCVIVLVGLNKKQIKELLPNMIGIKRTSNLQELVQIYSAADVFVNPSIEEVFGLVTAEALACGTPAIVFSSTPGEEILIDGCGYVAEKDNIYDIKKYVDTVRSNGKSFYSEKCVKRVKDNFNKNDRFDEYIELYRQLDKSGRKSH